MRSPVHAQASAGANVSAATLLEKPAPRLTRLFVNVTVERSLWPVHILLGTDATMAGLVRAAVATYAAAEGHRPPLPAADPASSGDAAAWFEQHLSKYSLDALEPEEKVLDLGFHNFFLCTSRTTER